ELCLAASQSLESTVWTTSSILAAVAIGAFAFSIGHQPPLEMTILSGVGTFVFIVQFIWYRMARRWWTIQHTHYLRMRHIEEELGILYIQRYHTFRDEVYDRGRGLSFSGPKTTVPEARKDEISSIGHYQSFGTCNFSH
ncbi:MAG: hypothetical protein JRF06_04970, partial [Deltaproteobacteria bacterium]|nr:hypothetical protein [Deltaproteobacteria bacterium]